MKFNEDRRGPCAAVRDGFPSPGYLGIEHTDEIRKPQKFAFKWKQFLFSAKSLCDIAGKSRAPETAGGTAVNRPLHAVDYRRCRKEPSARRNESENRRDRV